MTRKRIAIHGAAGRMGLRLTALAHADPDWEIVAALEAQDHPQLGQDAGLLAGVGPIDVPLTAACDQPLDVVVDFSVPDGAESATRFSLDRGIPLVVATTGLSEPQQQLIRQAATSIPIVWAPSMSTAVNLVMKLATLAGKTLINQPGGVDVEILERHHRFKQDAPSGTALRFGQLLSDAMGLDKHVHGRQGATGARTRNEIGYHAIRTGDNPGEHTIIFGMLGETIELTVRASNRDCYAAGALTAAKFVAGAAPGLYSMFDVLGINDAG